MPPIDSSSKSGRIITPVKGHVEFRDVKFTYPTRKDQIVLNGLSWTAKPGDTVALVGHSGCGKSTSVRSDPFCASKSENPDIIL